MLKTIKILKLKYEILPLAKRGAERERERESSPRGICAEQRSNYSTGERVNDAPKVFVLPKFIYFLFIFPIILGGFLFFGGEAMAASYYISTSGADTNNGTSSTTPFARHPWDATATSVSDSTVLQPGDIVYMKKGDVWHDVYLTVEDSGSSDEPIITTTKSDFGTGNDPKLYGSYNPSTLSFGVDGGVL